MTQMFKLSDKDFKAAITKVLQQEITNMFGKMKVSAKK